MTSSEVIVISVAPFWIYSNCGLPPNLVTETEQSIFMPGDLTSLEPATD